jgi:hypothetical protein
VVRDIRSLSFGPAGDVNILAMSSKFFVLFNHIIDVKVQNCACSHRLWRQETQNPNKTQEKQGIKSKLVKPYNKKEPH